VSVTPLMKRYERDEERREAARDGRRAAAA
jgi:hypothetical protein